MIYQDGGSDKFIWQLGMDGIELIETDGIHTSKINADFIQYTGLKDKSGKEIYEGDIVYEKSWWWGPGYVILHAGEVGLCKSPCAMQWVISKNIDNPESHLIFNLWDFNEIEVIGNVYENTELLKASE